MKNSTAWTIVIIIAVLIIIAAILVAKMPPPTSTDAGTASSTTSAASSTEATSADTVTYSCDSGSSITATFASSSASITLSDGRTFSLGHVVSADGGKYESSTGSKTDVVFWTKGTTAFITENGKTTYNNCVAGTQTSSGNGMTTFTDSTKFFSFMYPTMFTVSGGDGTYTPGWSAEATTSGIILASLEIPQSFEPKTNFGDAKFSVGVSSDPSAVSSCLSNGGGIPATKSQVTIHGVTYTKFTFSDAGAGNLYETTSYRTVKDNECYAIEYTIHSTNIGNYSPDQGITAFNEQKVRNILDTTAQSFMFLQ